jgi:ribonuclease P protein component
VPKAENAYQRNNMLFLASARLRNKAQFDCVFKAKHSVGTKQFVLYFIKNQEDNARIGIITSRKCSKKAVERNRIRRQVREYFRARQDEIGPCDLIVIARTPAAKQSNIECRAALNTLFARFYKHRDAQRSP